MPTETIALVIGLLGALNFVTFAMFWYDKQRAIQGGRRVREADLLALAMAGGSLGALAARRLFRHKTRKQPFATLLMLIVAVQAGGLIGFFLA